MPMPMPTLLRPPALARTALAAAAVSLALGAAAADFTLESPTVEDGQPLPLAHVFHDWGCGGKNLSPALAWRHAPAGTKSFAVTVYDPDAPTGSGWWHWQVVNLPATTSGLPEGAGRADGALLPAGAVQGPTDFGSPGFGGACPPPGDKPHRYLITVYALKVERIEIGPKTSAAAVGFALNSQKIAQARLTATYARP